MATTKNPKSTKTKTLDELAAEVASDQQAIEGDFEDTRTRVIRMGTTLRGMQKEQKKEQAETGQTWKEFLQEQKGGRASFPHEADCRKYMLISRHPKAYKPGMSIKQAYAEAGKWKKNGGKEPPTDKLTIKSRPLVTIGAACGKLESKIEKLNDADIFQLAEEQEWTEDERNGAIDAMTLVRQSINLLVKKLKQL